MRKINGFYYDSNYNRINLTDSYLKNLFSGYYKSIIKPSVGSCSGRGIKVFVNDGGKLKDNNGSLVDVDYLDKESDNFIVQEYLIQSSFMNTFNPTSVNTIRMMTYRSVKDDKIHVFNTILRIGGNGSFLDNAHAGGMFCGVSEKGELGKYVCNWTGHKQNKFNNIDFLKTQYYIPNFEGVKKLAISTSEKIPHIRMIAYDIMLDRNNEPKIIEFNCTGMAEWLFQFTNGSFFGKWTDEIIEYTISNKTKRKTIISI